MTIPSPAQSQVVRSSLELVVIPQAPPPVTIAEQFQSNVRLHIAILKHTLLLLLQLPMVVVLWFLLLTGLRAKFAWGILWARSSAQLTAFLAPADAQQPSLGTASMENGHVASDALSARVQHDHMNDDAPDRAWALLSQFLSLLFDPLCAVCAVMLMLTWRHEQIRMRWNHERHITMHNYHFVVGEEFVWFCIDLPFVAVALCACGTLVRIPLVWRLLRTNRFTHEEKRQALIVQFVLMIVDVLMLLMLILLCLLPWRLKEVWHKMQRHAENNRRISVAMGKETLAQVVLPEDRLPSDITSQKPLVNESDAHQPTVVVEEQKMHDPQLASKNSWPPVFSSSEMSAWQRFRDRTQRRPSLYSSLTGRYDPLFDGDVPEDRDTQQLMYLHLSLEQEQDDIVDEFVEYLFDLPHLIMALCLLVFPWRFITWVRLFWSMQLAIERRPMTQQQLAELCYDLPAVATGLLMAAIPILWSIFLLASFSLAPVLCPVVSAVASSFTASSGTFQPTVSWSAATWWNARGGLAIILILSAIALAFLLRCLLLVRDIILYSSAAPERRQSAYQLFCLALLDVPAVMCALTVRISTYRWARLVNNMSQQTTGLFSPILLGEKPRDASLSASDAPSPAQVASLPTAVSRSSNQPQPSDSEARPVVLENDKSAESVVDTLPLEPFCDRFQAHLVLFLEFFEIIVDLPFVLCGVLVTITLWRAVSLINEFMAAQHITQRRQLCVQHVVLFVCDLPSLVFCALPVLITGWRAPSLFAAWMTVPMDLRRGVNVAQFVAWLFDLPFVAMLPLTVYRLPLAIRDVLWHCDGIPSAQAAQSVDDAHKGRPRVGSESLQRDLLQDEAQRSPSIDSDVDGIDGYVPPTLVRASTSAFAKVSVSIDEDLPGTSALVRSSTSAFQSCDGAASNVVPDLETDTVSNVLLNVAPLPSPAPAFLPPPIVVPVWQNSWSVWHSVGAPHELPSFSEGVAYHRRMAIVRHVIQVPFDCFTLLVRLLLLRHTNNKKVFKSVVHVLNTSNNSLQRLLLLFFLSHTVRNTCSFNQVSLDFVATRYGGCPNTTTVHTLSCPHGLAIMAVASHLSWPHDCCRSAIYCVGHGNHPHGMALSSVLARC